MILPSDITALRHAGKLAEAYELALQMTRQGGSPDEWSRQGLFWVLRDVAGEALDAAEGSETNEETGEQMREFARKCLLTMERLVPHMADQDGRGHLALRKLQRRASPQYEEMKRYAELSRNEPVAAYRRATTYAGTQGQELDPALHESLGWIIYRYLKSQLGALPSVEVRGLLRDYLALNNDRPSLLHSLMMELALRFASTASDFNFFAFVKLWGVDNFRSEDRTDQPVNGKPRPSLVQRVAQQLAMHGVSFDEVCTTLQFPQELLTELWTRDWFNRLYPLHRANDNSALWRGISQYVVQLTDHVPHPRWHAKIVWLGLRHADAATAWPFLSLLTRNGAGALFIDKSWQPQPGKDGTQTYPPFAVQAATRSCYLIERAADFPERIALPETQRLLRALLHLFDQIAQRGVGTQATAQQQAWLRSIIEQK